MAKYKFNFKKSDGSVTSSTINIDPVKDDYNIITSINGVKGDNNAIVNELYVEETQKMNGRYTPKMKGLRFESFKAFSTSTENSGILSIQLFLVEDSVINETKINYPSYTFSIYLPPTRKLQIVSPSVIESDGSKHNSNNVYTNDSNHPEIYELKLLQNNHFLFRKIL